MRNLLAILMVALLLGCQKHEVDIAALNTNPYDNDYVGAQFLRVDSVRCFPLGQGALYQQRLYVRLSPEIRGRSDVQLRLVETTFPDTTVYNPSSTAVTVVMLNQQVTLGTEYCFLIDLIIGGGELRNQQLSYCAVAQI